MSVDKILAKGRQEGGRLRTRMNAQDDLTSLVESVLDLLKGFSVDVTHLRASFESWGWRFKPLIAMPCTM
jgi:hypothetical protein